MSDAKLKWLISLNVVVAIISIAALSISVYLHQTQVQIAYVNNQRVLNEFDGIKENSTLFQAKLMQWQANLDTLEKDIDREIAQFQKNYKSMSKRERETTAKLIEQKKQRYFSYKEAIDEKATEEDEKMSKAVLQQIDSYLLEFGESNDYDFIVGINDQGNLLYGRTQNNITDQIIEGLNKEYAGESTTE